MKRFSRVAVASVVMAMAVPLCMGDDSTVKLEGRGSRRDALSAISYKAFDTELLGKLENWSGKEPLDAAAIKGKPVLIVAWASWFKTSHERGLKIAQQALDANKDLVVIGVHHARGFEKAGEVAKALGFSGTFAQDSKGEVFSTLKVDGAGPNFYVIDRAGNLRFADVSSTSVEAAAKLVSSESAEDAKKAQAPAKAGPDAGGKAAAGGKPSPEAYAAAKWPAHNKGGQNLSAKNVQGKPLPVAFGKETWVTPKVELEGKVVVLDFWAIWCPPCRAASPIFDELQLKYKDKAVIIGVSGQAQPRSPEDVASIKAYLKTNKCEYSHVNDVQNQRVYKSLEIQGIPHVVILSTDGVVRWQGNPHDPVFKKALDAVVKADPMLAGAAGGAGAGEGEKPKP